MVGFDAFIEVHQETGENARMERERRKKKERRNVKGETKGEFSVCCTRKNKCLEEFEINYTMKWI